MIHTPPLCIKGNGKVVEGVVLWLVACECEEGGMLVVRAVMLEPVHAQAVTITGV